MSDYERIPPPTFEEVLEMEDDALEMVRFRLEDERDNIQHQIEIDAAIKLKCEEEQDPVWVARARHAIRCRVTRLCQIGRILKLRAEEAA